MKRKIITAIIRGLAGIDLDKNEDGKISWPEIVEALVSLGTTVLGGLYILK